MYRYIYIYIYTYIYIYIHTHVYTHTQHKCLLQKDIFGARNVGFVYVPTQEPDSAAKAMCV